MARGKIHSAGRAVTSLAHVGHVTCILGERRASTSVRVLKTSSTASAVLASFHGF